jgi:hypothetical protein
LSTRFHKSVSLILAFGLLIPLPSEFWWRVWWLVAVFGILKKLIILSKRGVVIILNSRYNLYIRNTGNTNNTRNTQMTNLKHNIRVLNENKFFHVWGLIIGFSVAINVLCKELLA